MPKKLLKNPNGLAEAVDHLRPRGSYDELAPPGGWPLPGYIKRKFSFAPRLPNVSLISLLPDFASSSLDLGIQLDESEAKRVTHDTPISLRVHYSLLSLRDTANGQRSRATPKPSLPKIDTTVTNVTKNRSSPRAQDVVLATVFEGRSTQQPRGLRRVHGRECLQMTNPSSPASDLESTDRRLSSFTASSEPSTPNTALDFTDEEDSATDVRKGLAPAIRYNEADLELAERLAQAVPNLFGSFFIVDFQLPEKPVRVTSYDMIPDDIAADEALFFDEGKADIPYQLLTVFDGKQMIQTLPFEGDLVDCRALSTAPSHRVFGQIDLTDFLRRELDDDMDIWLEVAYEEMEKAGIKPPRPPWCPTFPTTGRGHAQAEQVSRMARSLHRDYFIIGVLDKQQPGFGITLVSPSLVAKSKEMQDPRFLDWYNLEDHLNTPQRFVTRVYWKASKCEERLYCVPMFGPGLACWLCFLVDKELPELWP
ncbi:MAG: hypothetical protein Q9219_005845 [cf. Caloplaca sp. 3 TL-2023]